MEQLTTMRKQRGAILFIALIFLVALTLAGLALVRSVDTGNLIAGNLAFKQGTLQVADVGVEVAATAIPTIATTAADTPKIDGTGTYFYYPTRRLDDATGMPTQKEYNPADLTAGAVIDWTAVPTASTTAGNTVQVVIDRLCTGPAPVTDIQGKCFADNPTATGTKKAGGIVFSSADTVYYRVTVRVSGPRNTVSVVQAIVSK